MYNIEHLLNTLFPEFFFMAFLLLAFFCTGLFWEWPFYESKFETKTELNWDYSLCIFILSKFIEGHIIPLLAKLFLAHSFMDLFFWKFVWMQMKMYFFNKMSDDFKNLIYFMNSFFLQPWLRLKFLWTTIVLVFNSIYFSYLPETKDKCLSERQALFQNNKIEVPV